MNYQLAAVGGYLTWGSVYDKMATSAEHNAPAYKFSKIRQYPAESLPF